MKSRDYLITSDNYKTIDTFMTGFILFDGMYISSSQSLKLFIELGGRVPLFNEGRYTLCINNGKMLEVLVDPMGQDIIYKYESASCWAISNSYYNLTAYLKSKSIKTTFSFGSSVAFLLPGGHGNQLISNSTMCDEIKILGVSKKVRIDIKKNKLTVIDKEKKYNEVTAESREGLKRLDSWFSIWTSFIINLVSSSEFITCDVTGGRDSRIILGLIILSGVDMNKIRFVSNPNQAEDFKIAELLADEFGFALNKTFTKSKIFNIRPNEKYDLWKKGCLGVYTPVYFCGVRVFDQTYHLHGGGGELYRKIYLKPPADQCENFASKLRSYNLPDDEFRDVFSEGINESGSQMSDFHGLDKHYFNFRNRFHFGRGWYKDIGKALITPLNSRLLYSISRPLNLDHNQDLLIAAILYKCNPRLIDIPFDKEYKSFSVPRGEVHELSSNINFKPADFRFYVEPGIDHSDISAVRHSSSESIAEMMKAEIMKVEVKEKFMEHYPENIYNQAISNINSTTDLVKSRCQLPSFVLSVSNIS